jgi:hypothetical protein
MLKETTVFEPGNLTVIRNGIEIPRGRNHA